MTKKNKKLSEFVTGNDKHENGDTLDEETEKGKCSTQPNKTSDSTPCNFYQKMRDKYSNRLDEIGINPPKCGYCIAFLCNQSSFGTAVTYNSSLSIFIESIHQQGICIEDIELSDVRDYIESRGRQNLSKSRIKNDKSAILGVIRRFESEHREIPGLSWKISNNIDASRHGVDTVYERKPLDSEEIIDLLSASDDLRNQLMMLSSLELGARSGAICKIKTHDVDLEEKLIELKNTKSGGTYVMPMTEGLSSLMRYWIKTARPALVQNQDNDYLFPSRGGGKLSLGQYRDIVHDAAKEAGLQEEIAQIPTDDRSTQDGANEQYRSKWRVDVHVFRHTFSSLLKNSGVSKNSRRYALDHHTDVTDRYGEDEEACRKEIRTKFEGIDVSKIQDC